MSPRRLVPGPGQLCGTLAALARRPPPTPRNTRPRPLQAARRHFGTSRDFSTWLSGLGSRFLGTSATTPENNKGGTFFSRTVQELKHPAIPVLVAGIAIVELLIYLKRHKKHENEDESLREERLERKRERKASSTCGAGKAAGGGLSISQE